MAQRPGSKGSKAPPTSDERERSILTANSAFRVLKNLYAWIVLVFGRVLHEYAG
jgi:hypothetical protein